MLKALERTSTTVALELSPQAESFISEGNKHSSKKSSEKAPEKPEKANPKKIPMAKLSARIPERINDGLFNASVDRKRRKLPNHTQQDIVAEALEPWLKENGYLD